MVNTYLFTNLIDSEQKECADWIKVLVEKKEERYVCLFNTLVSPSPRKNIFESFSGIGSKKAMNIVHERNKKSFTSYKDIETRSHIDNVPDLIYKKIIEEIIKTPKSSHNIFVKYPIK